MAEIVRMPKLSDTMTEGVVAEWHKKVGDEVESGELLAEIETDKATMEFESFQDGVLLHIGVEKGQSAPVDSILCVLGEKGEDITALLAGDQGGAVQEAAPIEAPKEVTPSPTPAPVPAAASAPSPAPVAVAVASTSSNGRVKASPLAKKIAEDKGINLEQVSGSGDGGRVVKRDVENFVPAAQSAAPSFAAVSGQESYTEVPVSQMRKTIARRLAESKFTAPHFYLTVSIDMDNAMAARKMANSNEDVRISFNDMVIKAAAIALKKHPAVNSSWLGDKIRYNEHVHIGVAVAVEDGLLVPVVRFADAKPMSVINAEVKDFAQKAKSKKLQPQDWEGNTFTISNLGMFGIEEFTAIVNPPDACILAVGGIQQVPVVKNGQVVPGNVMKVTLSCDHRVVDGASGAAFLQTFKGMLENPIMMLV
ncbi:MAG: pyruvate dehydrogenase complex dihydrolipoamide acetyltransferase [Bacteroidetes bacterium]|nr:pyruvate dehydrogenase complex dihydrolipoamide acetyltransferase [Bacteroidota bacterium]